MVCHIFFCIEGSSAKLSLFTTAFPFIRSRSTRGSTVGCSSLVQTGWTSCWSLYVILNVISKFLNYSPIIKCCISRHFCIISDCGQC